MDTQQKTLFGQTTSALEISPSKHETYQPLGTIFSTQGDSIQVIHRLIVLVPDAEFDEVHMAREVWEMAAASKLAILLLGMCNDTLQELAIRRKLVNLAALIRDTAITVETHVEYGRDWLHGVRSVLAKGDAIVCHEEQHIGFRQQPIVNVLASLRAPIWAISGIYPAKITTYPRWISNTVYWSATVAILAAFFYIQSQIIAIPNTLVNKTMLILSFVAELGSLYFWNAIFS